MKHQTLLVLAALGLATPAMAINKCTDASGNVTFSDLPCPATQKSSSIKVRPSGGQAAADMPPPPPPPKAPAPAPAAPAAEKAATPPAGAPPANGKNPPPAAGQPAAKPAEAAATEPKPEPPKPKTAYEKMLDEAHATDVAKQKRILRERIDQLNRDYDRMGDRMRAEIDALRNKKPDVNVANGATWEQSINVEMQAVTVTYDNRMKSNRAEVDRLRDEMNNLK